MTHGGLSLRKHQFKKDALYFFKGFGEAPNVRQRTSKMQIHTFIEMSRFLYLLGSQKVQISIIQNQHPIMSALIKTNPHALEWIDTIPGKLSEVTIDVDVPYEIIGSNSLRSMIIIIINIVVKPLLSHRVKKVLNRIRLYLAIFVEVSLRLVSRFFNSH